MLSMNVLETSPSCQPSFSRVIIQVSSRFLRVIRDLRDGGIRVIESLAFSREFLTSNLK